jgi:hypothetical protein
MQSTQNRPVGWHLLYARLNGSNGTQLKADITLEEFDDMDSSRDVKIKTSAALDVALEVLEQRGSMPNEPPAELGPTIMLVCGLLEVP